MRYPAQTVRSFCEAVLREAGLGEADAAAFADSLLFSEMRGVSSHGITRLGAYAGRIREGALNPAPRFRTLRESPAALTIDADNAPGVLAGVHAMDRCMDKAAGSGACFAAVRGSSHFASGGYLAMRAARRGMIGIAMCNSDPSVAPHGGARPLLGTNPLSVAVPAGERDAMLVDMATSLVAKGKVNLAEKLGQPIPEGWIVDGAGNPSTDPAAIRGGALLPFGGAKGYGIALLVEVLGGALSGAKASGAITSFFGGGDPAGYTDIGMFFGALDVSHFTEPKAFAAWMDGLYQRIAATPPAPGFEAVRFPGQRGREQERDCLAHGIALSDAILKELHALAEGYGIPPLAM